MPKPSAGLLMYRHRDGRLEVLLAHPGGPLWASKDLGAWSIPKGQIVSGEDALDAARREFHERTGFESSGPVVGLGFLKQQSGGKIIHAWALEGDCDPAALRSGTFSIEWPPRSGKVRNSPRWIVSSGSAPRSPPANRRGTGLVHPPSRRSSRRTAFRPDLA